MALYNLYAGMSGGFNSVTFRVQEDYETHDEATNAAEQLAKEEYESYDGSGGIMSYDECQIQVLEDNGLLDEYDSDSYEFLDIDTMVSENGLEDEVSELYADEQASWIEYYAVLAVEDTEQDEQIFDNDEDDLP